MSIINFSVIGFHKLVAKSRFIGQLRFCTAPEPPLCKGRWQKSLIFVGGIDAVESYGIRHTTGKIVTFAAQSLSHGLRRDSSLYTREPLPRSYKQVAWGYVYRVATMDYEQTEKPGFFRLLRHYAMPVYADFQSFDLTIPLSCGTIFPRPGRTVAAGFPTGPG